MQNKTLPQRPSLDQLRRQAKDLLKQIRAGESASLERLRKFHPEFESSDPQSVSVSRVVLNQAQFVIAREYGFASWPKLKQHVRQVMERIDPHDHVALVRGVVDQIQLDSTDACSIVELIEHFTDRLKLAHSEKEPWAHVVLNNHAPELLGRPKAEVFTAELSDANLRDVAARYFGFQSHADFRTSESATLNPVFEEAADSIVNGEIGTLSALLKSNPNLVKQRSAFGHRSTLLHYVAANGVEIHRQRVPRNATQIARLLLEAGAEPDALAETYGGGPNQTTLSLLITSAHPHAAGLVRPLLGELVDHGANVNGLRNDGHPLQVALEFGYTSAAHALIHYGAKIFNLAQAAGGGSRHDVQSFLETVPAQTDLDAALYLSARHGQANVLDLLVEAGANLNACGFFDAPALHWAAIGGHLNTVQFLVNQGADPNVRDERFKAHAAGWANEGNNVEIRDWLLNHGCVASIVEAAAFGRIDLVKKHLQRDPKQVNLNEGRTALHEAAGRGSLELAKLLLEHNADRSATDEDGLTPLDWAKARKQNELVDLLSER